MDVESANRSRARQPAVQEVSPAPSGGGVHPAWQRLFRYCPTLGHGEIERIRIQDGLPVCAEVITRKIRWS
jgi:hypothetical protein